MWLMAFKVIGWWQERREARNRFYAQVADIALKHWKLICVLALVIYAALSINSLIKQRDQAIQHAKTAQNTLKVYRDMVQHEAELQRAKVARLREEGKKNVEAITANHTKQLKLIAKQHGKDLKDDQTNDYRNTLTDRVREQTADGSGRVPQDDKNRLAETDCNATIARERTLIEAAKVCTNDYNYCKAYVDSEQTRLGVE